MPSFGDSIFLFVLALILFGPKKLPELARQLGKLMAEFRRASNEFRVQMEDELRVADQAERQKQIAAIEAAAPSPALASGPLVSTNTIAPPTNSEAHTDTPASAMPAANRADYESETNANTNQHASTVEPSTLGDAITSTNSAPAADPSSATTSDGITPLPIAVSGELRIMPPATGLPTGTSSLSALINSVPRSAVEAEATAPVSPATTLAAVASASEEVMRG